MRKLVVALACRNKGSRLYGKPLQNLDIKNGITILDNIVACLSSFDCIDSVILGIAEGDENLDFVNVSVFFRNCLSVQNLKHLKKQLVL